MNRRSAQLLIAVGIFLAMGIIAATSLSLARHPSPPPINHCPPTDAANPWCIK